jgi:methyl-accepting chemotaxis protein
VLLRSLPISAILSPAVSYLLRLTQQQKLRRLTFLFMVPLGILYFDVREHVSTETALWVLGVLLLAVYGMVSFFIQGDIAWRLVAGVFKQLAEGDLTAQIKNELGGFFAQLLRAMRDVNGNLGRMVAQVRASSRALSLLAQEIASGHSHLSQRTEQQASTLEETASGMEELSGTARQNADNCKLASRLAQNAEKLAHRGATAVHGVVEGMGRIDQSSKQMADVIGVIQGIAFQTNILALNAAVEAARAGEQGRGFAVVASEVRALAQRSAAATREIKSLIEDSVSEIRDGSKKAEGAGRVIDEIVTSVQKVNQLIGEIAVASAEQSTGVGEINRAILQLESVTQQNAALVEEATASSMSFQDHADRLRELVMRFRIADEVPAAPPPAATAEQGDDAAQRRERRAEGSLRGPPGRSK